MALRLEVLNLLVVYTSNKLKNTYLAILSSPLWHEL